MSSEMFQDEAIILRVRNWQTADKYAVCFCREHGKIPFVAYGAAYPRSQSGRLVQPFVHLQVTLAPGRKVATLRSCESLEMPQPPDWENLAYGAIIGEVAENLLGEEEPQEEVFQLLLEAFRLLGKRNKRLVTDSTLLKLLSLCGLNPILDVCTSCNEPVTEDGYFSLVQGGFLCRKCAMGDELPFTLPTRDLMEQLLHLDLNEPPDFTVRGRELMSLEKILYQFILYQTDRPIRSLEFLAQMEKTAHG